MNNFLRRSLSGAALVSITIISLIYNCYTFALVFSSFSLLCLYEYSEILKAQSIIITKRLFLGTGFFIFIITFLASSEIIPKEYFVFVIPFLALFFILELFNTKINYITKLSAEIFGLLYIAIPFALLNNILFITGTYNYEPLLILLLLIWANDTGAYIIGVNFGKHPLAKKISPKKSIEGFIGGFAVSLIAAYFLSENFTFLGSGQLLGYVGIISIIGTIGDLIESRLKRTANIKDSSNLLPGHGGFLDRFDSLIFSIPFIYLLLVITI